MKIDFSQIDDAFIKQNIDCFYEPLNAENAEAFLKLLDEKIEKRE